MSTFAAAPLGLLKFMLPHGWYWATTLVMPSLPVAMPKPTLWESFQTTCKGTQVLLWGYVASM